MIQDWRGYHLLAEFMSSHPGLSFVNTFGRLHTYDLLVQHGELMLLSEDLDRAVLADRNSDDPETKIYESCVDALRGPHSDPNKGFQWKRVKELRAALKEFGKLCPAELPRWCAADLDVSYPGGR